MSQPEAELSGARRPGRPRWGFGDVAITLVGTIVLASVFEVLLVALEKGAWSSPTAKAWGSVLALTVPWLVLGGWPLVASWTKGDGPVRDFGLTLTWRAAGIGVAGGVAALVVATLVLNLQVAITHKQFGSAVGDLATSTTSASRAALAVLALCTAVGAPIVEELAFRGLTYGSFLRIGQPALWAGVWTTVIFAVFHFEFVRLPVLLVLGGFLAAVRAYTGRTAASMVTHMTINLSGAIAILHATVLTVH